MSNGLPEPLPRPWRFWIRLAHMIRLVTIVEGFSSPDQRDDVAAFFAAHPAASAERAIRQALERIDLNAAWLARNREALATLH